MRSAATGCRGIRRSRQVIAGSLVDGGTDLQEEATMSIASIAGSSAWSHQLTGPNAMANLVAAAPKAATGPSGPATGGSLMHDIVSTLQHLAFPGSGSGIGSAAGAASATLASAPAATSAVKSAQDLQSFMATLMQALHQAGSQSSQGIHSGHGVHAGHGQVSTQLQSLLQEIDGGSGAASTGAPAVSSLETSFQSLMQDLSSGAATATAAGASGTPSLQGFLQTLLSNLQTQGNTQSAGLLIHATA
jgi:hypothetical protein